MKNVLVVILAFLMIGLQKQAMAQTPEMEVQKVIEQLFDAMRTKDGVAAGAVFLETAPMQTVVAGENGSTLGSNSVADFVNRIATTPEDVNLDERILDYQIKVDGDLAAAWTPYEFYVNDQFSHCGVNSFQLVRTAEGWKISYIIDTRRKEGCNQ
ncbi:nuclear transport factor 2 family protein [Algoriphagus sp. NF]|uniref:nuclear transport factor 2 family protein n=1 Tax=Algoriphagus sp. NF TaxID=2992756 RepID=UPI00237C36E1|nr:nuclear transport factor 2 family protein [Algoriphagus sp. NF]MDE0558747.1 nuclear transport factor 2 family protein [Algoriphagus sp. NF]